MSPGILLVDKPGGMTSHDVVARARRALGTRKVGHAGTLDPMATGLLLLGVASATRLLTHLVGLGKRYMRSDVSFRKHMDRLVNALAEIRSEASVAA